MPELQPWFILPSEVSAVLFQWQQEERDQRRTFGSGCSPSSMKLPVKFLLTPVLFGLLHRLRNLKPFPAGKEKDQNHLDLTLCSFHDKSPAALQQAVGDEIREFQRVREGSERSVLLHERVQNYPGKTGGVKQAELTPASNFLFQQRCHVTAFSKVNISKSVELCEPSPKAAVLSAWLLVKADNAGEVLHVNDLLVYSHQDEFHHCSSADFCSDMSILQANGEVNLLEILTNAMVMQSPPLYFVSAGETQEESPCERAGWVKSEESEGWEQSGSGLLPHSPPVPIIHDVLGENLSFLWAEREPSLSILLAAALPYSRRVFKRCAPQRDSFVSSCQRPCLFLALWCLAPVAAARDSFQPPSCSEELPC
ncbi:hypothetical protein Anapl_00074 [Anas platyrhynchos]|uniref:Uncharacterized protein n=1 Tax=Anas platyrhynchos TaxID=8839 RepID=R0LDM9_ANAPL|nr:hypothetical protein Anapl_00074 [Anas platyrhynchos]